MNIAQLRLQQTNHMMRLRSGGVLSHQQQEAYRVGEQFTVNQDVDIQVENAIVSIPEGTVGSVHSISNDSVVMDMGENAGKFTVPVGEMEKYFIRRATAPKKFSESSNLQALHHKLANDILTGRADMGVLRDHGVDDPHKLAHDILNGRVDHAVLADKLRQRVIPRAQSESNEIQVGSKARIKSDSHQFKSGDVVHVHSKSGGGMVWVSKSPDGSNGSYTHHSDLERVSESEIQVGSKARIKSDSQQFKSGEIVHVHSKSGRGMVWVSKNPDGSEGAYTHHSDLDPVFESVDADLSHHAAQTHPWHRSLLDHGYAHTRTGTGSYPGVGLGAPATIHTYSKGSKMIRLTHTHEGRPIAKTLGKDPQRFDNHDALVAHLRGRSESVNEANYVTATPGRLVQITTYDPNIGSNRGPKSPGHGGYATLVGQKGMINTLFGEINGVKTYKVQLVNGGEFVFGETEFQVLESAQPRKKLDLHALHGLGLGL